MKFGLHNSSWLDEPDPAETFEAAKAKANGRNVTVSSGSRSWTT